jgi:DUF2934 family protein
MPRKSISDNPIVVSTGAAAAAPARRKSASKRTARHVENPQGVTETAAVVTEIPTLAVTIEPSQEEIAKLAYSYWEARGYTAGSPEEDWLRAEQELRAALVAR